MEEKTTEQRMQAVIDFNKMMEQLPVVLPQLTQEQKEAVAAQIAQRKEELGI